MSKRKSTAVADSPSMIILKNRGYKMIAKIGQGSYAKVYMGEFVPTTIVTSAHEQNVIKFACKLIDTKNSPREFVQKFLPRELNVLMQLQHPHIIHIHSILQIRQKYYIFMRYAEQGDLLDFIIKHGVINENQARVWARQIALALQYLHEMNIAHRDMKCENILVTENYNVKLSDFGFARYTIDSKRKPIPSDTYCGSMSYASPEILHGRPYNPKISDIWSYGVFVFVMLNKSMPFNDVSPRALYENQLKRNFRFRKKVEPILSPEVKTLMDNLLEPDPQRRYLIDNVINSDWIAMDKRLRVLGPTELAALSKAVNSRVVPPEEFTIPQFRKSVKLDMGLENKQGEPIDVIIPYKQSEQPRLSENSKIPSLHVQLQVIDDLTEIDDREDTTTSLKKKSDIEKN